jgi:hypothetical protein
LLDADCSVLRARLAVLFVEVAARRDEEDDVAGALRPFGDSTETGGNEVAAGFASCASAAPNDTTPITIEDAAANPRRFTTTGFTAWYFCTIRAPRF